MTVLAALGGVTSTYVNSLGDAIQATLGFAGGTQWASGLHVIWIVLAYGILRKPGVGILTGIIKGFVELMSGNTHGVIILLVDLVAGLLVDFGFFIFRNRFTLMSYLVAGGLATSSNVLIFQIFATLPSNILAMSAIALLFLVSFVSGIIFSGLVPYGLVNTLAKGGLVKLQHREVANRKIGLLIISAVFILAITLAIFLRGMLSGPPHVVISGSVNNSYAFPDNDYLIEPVTREMEYRGAKTQYTGFLLNEIVDFADPLSKANTILIAASDGYSFLISFDELDSNPNILLVETGEGKTASYDVVGPESSKAWIRNVSTISIIETKGLSITDIREDKHVFDPDEWVSDMDSTQVNLPEGSKKLQGVAIYRIIESLEKTGMAYEVIFHTEDNNLVFNWEKIENNDDLRVFTIVGDDGISFVLAEMSGEVLLYPLTGIEIN
jgi:energy-coupling factor transport system substrate-specific component